MEIEWTNMKDLILIKNSEDNEKKHDIKKIEEWLEKFKKSNSKSFLALFFDNGNAIGQSSIEHVFGFRKDEGTRIIGCLEVAKSTIMKSLQGE